MRKPLTEAQRQALEDLLTVVEMSEVRLRASLPGAPGQLTPAGPPLADVLRQILEALRRCKDADL